MDSTVFHFVSELLDRYNRKYGDNVTHEDILDWEIRNHINNKEVDIIREFANGNFIYNTKPLPNAIQIINELKDKYHIIFLTASHPVQMYAKHIKLAKYFDWYDYRENLIISSKKSLCKGYALIDDALHNVVGNDSVEHRILLDKPWNRKNDDVATNLIRVSNWLDIKHVLEFLE